MEEGLSKRNAWRPNSAARVIALSLYALSALIASGCGAAVAPTSSGTTLSERTTKPKAQTPVERRERSDDTAERDSNVPSHPSAGKTRTKTSKTPPQQVDSTKDEATPNEGDEDVSTVEQAKEKETRQRPIRTLYGKVSYYHDSLAGNRTANGEQYDPKSLTAAHLSLPFGTVVRIINKDTGASVVVRVNDRGPFGGRGRIFDLSRAAAAKLGMLRRGVIAVRAEVLSIPKESARTKKRAKSRKKRKPRSKKRARR